MWHAWVWRHHPASPADEPEWLGQYGSMDWARDVVEGEFGERLWWDRRERGDRWEAWSHRP